MAESNAIIHLCNSALYRIGEEPISALDEGTVPANVCAALYADCADTLLTWQTWPFATVRQSLARLEYAPPSDYAYYYALPSQPRCLRIIDINLDHAGYGYQRELAIHPTDPNDQREAIATDAPAVVLRYIGRTLEGTWAPLFTQAVIVYLAQAICPSITGKASLKQSLLLELYGQGREPGLLEKLRQVIGHEDSPRQMPLPTSYLDVRGGYGSELNTRYP